MFCRLKGLNKLFTAALIPGLSVNKLDNVEAKTETSKKMLEEAKSQHQSGMDRIYLMFSTDEFGEPSPHVVNVGNIMMMSVFFGAAIGGFFRSRVAFLDFVERNDATSFESHIDAKKKLQDKVTVGFARGAFQMAWRLSLFTGIYTLTSTTISVYRGKSGILEHITAGLITGATYKYNLGLRGIVVGGTLGMFLGTFAGVTFWGITKLTGVSMDDAVKFSHNAKKSRNDSFKAAVDEYMKEKEPIISHRHDEKPGISDKL